MAADNRSLTGEEWLDELVRRLGKRSVDVAVTRVDRNTFALALGTRGMIAHDTGDSVWLAPSASSGPLAAKPQDRVRHFDIQQYGIAEPTIDVAVTAALRHLLP
jgi:hypothetical protein